MKRVTWYLGARKLAAAVVLTGLAIVAVPVSATAQGQFDPVLRVNDRLVSRYEMDQRALLLSALGAPGDLDKEARDRLIDEKLYRQEARALSITVPDTALEEGVATLAQRGNLTPEEFVTFLAERGVAEETMRDFVEAGLLWREVVRLRFVSRTRITEEEVDRAVTLAGREGGARVLLSEIILPARTPEESAQSQALALELSELDGFPAFSAAAQRVSASASRARGGRIDWLPVGTLPGPLRNQVMTLPVGGITDPVPIQNAIAVFQLRAMEEVPVTEAEVLALDYAEFRIPGGSVADAAKIAARVDTCDDLYGVARRLPEDRLVRATLPPDQVPADIRAALQPLDENETSTAVRRGDVQLLLMLCGRTNAASAEIDRAEIRRSLVNQRIGSYAAGYLADLRAQALIVDLE